jgi:hypothetical protein
MEDVRSVQPQRTFRSSASFGKRQEYVAIAELLKRGYDVYLTLVDDMGIDCVIRQGSNRYFDVQIKARSRSVVGNNAALFPHVEVTSARRNYVFVFYSEMADMYWVIPSTEIVKPGFANVLKSGANKGRYRLKLANFSTAQGRPLPRPKYAKWEGAFEEVLGKPALAVD